MSATDRSGPTPLAHAYSWKITSPEAERLTPTAMSTATVAR